MFERASVIEKVLREYPNTRNSDKELILQVWEQQGLVLNETQRRFFLEKVIPPETIRRNRQKLQEKGLYPSDQAIARARREFEAKTAREVAQSNHAENVRMF